MEKGGKIQTSTIVKIPEGKLEEFKQYAMEAMRIVKEKDRGHLDMTGLLAAMGLSA